MVQDIGITLYLNPLLIDLSEIENFHIGDHLIHSEYGLGKYLGLKTIKIHGLKSDCLTLSYLGGDKVFVPVQNINLITKYGGANSHMAIRCSELNIPAAIGVGEKNFTNNF